MVLFGNGGRNARLIGSALLIITFIAGALAGAAALRVVNAERPEIRKSAKPAGPMRGGPRRLLQDEQFATELGLTAQQRTQIKEILDRRDVAAKAMWQDFEPRLKEFAEATHAEIKAILSDEQEAKFDAALELRRTSWKKQRHCPPDSAKPNQGI